MTRSTTGCCCHRDDPILPLLKQRGELFYVMDENPTAGDIAKLIFTHARAKGLPCSRGAAVGNVIVIRQLLRLIFSRRAFSMLV